MRAFLLSSLLLFPLAASAADLPEPLAAVMAKAQSGDAIVVDVREAGELKDGMIDGAVWLATSEIKDKSPRYTEILKALPKDKPVYVHCASGIRSGNFAETLEKDGYKATNLGGFPELLAAGFKTKKVSDAKSQPCPYLCGPLGGAKQATK